MYSSPKKQSPETENLYRVFAKYNTGAIPPGCPCCVKKSDQARLTSKPLRELTWIELSHFSFNAMSTWGHPEMFKRFTPRILELLPQNPPYDLEIHLGKFRLAEFRSWPQEERSAVQDFLRALWEKCLYGKIFNHEEESFLCGLVCAGCDIQPFLEAWLYCGTAHGYAILAEFANAPFTTAFWNQGFPEQSETDKWLLSPKTLSSLELLFEKATDPALSQSLAAAVDAIESYQARMNFVRAT